MEKGKGKRKSAKTISCSSFFRFDIVYTGEDHEKKWLKIANKKITHNNNPFKSFFYAAFYYGGDNLSIYPVVMNSDGNEIIIPYSNSKNLIHIDEFTTLVGPGLIAPWKIFFENASFRDIVRSMAGEYASPNVTEEDRKKALASSLNAPDPCNIFDSDKYLLELIREKPRSLHDTEIRQRFIDILTAARWGIKKEIKREAKYLLRDHLISIDHGGLKPTFSGMDYKLPYDLMLRLASFFAEKCKKILIDLKYDEKNDRHFGGYHCESYNALIDKLKSTLHNSYRLHTLSPESLTLLINKPAAYVENILKDHLGISKKTFTRRVNQK